MKNKKLSSLLVLIAVGLGLIIAVDKVQENFFSIDKNIIKVKSPKEHLAILFYDNQIFYSQHNKILNPKMIDKSINLGSVKGKIETDFWGRTKPKEFQALGFEIDNSKNVIKYNDNIYIEKDEGIFLLLKNYPQRKQDKTSITDFSGKSIKYTMVDENDNMIESEGVLFYTAENIGADLSSLNGFDISEGVLLIEQGDVSVPFSMFPVKDMNWIIVYDEYTKEAFRIIINEKI